MDKSFAGKRAPASRAQAARPSQGLQPRQNCPVNRTEHFTVYLTALLFLAWLWEDFVTAAVCVVTTLGVAHAGALCSIWWSSAPASGPAAREPREAAQRGRLAARAPEQTEEERERASSILQSL